jgi:hypothetical protein
VAAALSLMLGAGPVLAKGVSIPNTTLGAAVRAPLRAHRASGPIHAAPPHQHLDGRYGHDRYYYDHGYRLRALPQGGVDDLWGHDGYRYCYDQGNWFRWNGRVWIACDAPLGVFVPSLPPFYTTIAWHGIPYYYANNTYYAWDDMQQAYEVVPAPSGTIGGSGAAIAPPASVPPSGA